MQKQQIVIQEWITKVAKENNKKNKNVNIYEKEWEQEKKPVYSHPS